MERAAVYVSFVVFRDTMATMDKICCEKVDGTEIRAWLTKQVANSHIILILSLKNGVMRLYQVCFTGIGGISPRAAAFAGRIFLSLAWILVQAHVLLFRARHLLSRNHVNGFVQLVDTGDIFKQDFCLKNFSLVL